MHIRLHGYRTRLFSVPGSQTGYTSQHVLIFIWIYPSSLSSYQDKTICRLKAFHYLCQFEAVNIKEITLKWCHWPSLSLLLPGTAQIHYQAHLRYRFPSKTPLGNLYHRSRLGLGRHSHSSLVFRKACWAFSIFLLCQHQTIKSKIRPHHSCGENYLRNPSHDSVWPCLPSICCAWACNVKEMITGSSLTLYRYARNGSKCHWFFR